MSESKHTPGPWVVDESTDGRSKGFIRHQTEEGHSVAICRVTGTYWSHEQREANRRLIAAAPELLEALEEIVARNEIQHWFNLDQARFAIAKAKGESA